MNKYVCLCVCLRTQETFSAVSFLHFFHLFTSSGEREIEPLVLKCQPMPMAKEKGEIKRECRKNCLRIVGICRLFLFLLNFEVLS